MKIIDVIGLQIWFIKEQIWSTVDGICRPVTFYYFKIFNFYVQRIFEVYYIYKNIIFW